MIASVHSADIGARTALRFRAPRAAEVPGLRNAHSGLAVPFGGFAPVPILGRTACIALWDDDQSLETFLASDHKSAATMGAGLTLRLEPIRAYGSWPGLPEDTEKRREPETEGGPVVVLTLGQLIPKRGPAFLAASRKAEHQVVKAPGIIWTMACTDLAKLFFASISVWESAEATMAYAFEPGGHADAMRARQDDGFHKQDAFVRFRPYASSGSLEKKPALPADWLAAS